ncbi:putative F-box domain, galactose oxidase/kelch, beta-propeller, F-box associated interaction [Helianthus debilis subsp. tardiflorus]
MPPRKRPCAKRLKKKDEREQDGNETPIRVPGSSPRGKRARIRGQKKAEQQQGDDSQSSVADVYLPEHILQQIFLRMPTKPLVQLKCLSKQWNRQISDPNFMTLRSRRMIFIPSFPFYAIDTVTGDKMFKLFCPLIDPNRYYHEITIVGSFNGILLLNLKYSKTRFVDYYSTRYHMILYNPFTGKSKTVPQGSYDPAGYYVYGFGYGTTSHDLRIVRLKDKFHGKSKSFEVFSLKTWSWSRASELIGDYCIDTIYQGIFANGFLYWKAGTNTHGLPLILALDIKTMVFSEIKVPDGYWLSRLGTYNGRLCMICNQKNADIYEFRVMNEHGFGESVWMFASWFTPLIIHACTALQFCILDDGKLLMLIPSQKVIIYDMFNDSYKVVNALKSSHLAGWLQAVEYVESPISPLDICTVSI